MGMDGHLGREGAGRRLSTKKGRREDGVTSRLKPKDDIYVAFTDITIQYTLFRRKEGMMGQEVVMREAAKKFYF